MDDDLDITLHFPPRSTPSPKIHDSFDEGRDWSFDFVSEEVGYKNEIRREVRWKDWKSEVDGAKNTWPVEEELPPAAVKNYNKRQEKRRLRVAKATSSITIWGSRDIINDRTRLRAQAYDEKLKMYPLDQSLNRKLALLDVDDDQDGPEPAETHSDSASTLVESNSQLRRSNRSFTAGSFSNSTTGPSRRAPVSSSSLKRKASAGSDINARPKKVIARPNHTPSAKSTSTLASTPSPTASVTSTAKPNTLASQKYKARKSFIASAVSDALSDEDMAPPQAEPSSSPCTKESPPPSPRPKIDKGKGRAEPIVPFTKKPPVKARKTFHRMALGAEEENNNLGNDEDVCKTEEISSSLVGMSSLQLTNSSAPKKDRSVVVEKAREVVSTSDKIISNRVERPPFSKRKESSTKTPISSKQPEYIDVSSGDEDIPSNPVKVKTELMSVTPDGDLTDDELARTTPPAPVLPPETRATILSSIWTKAAAEAGAAPITFVGGHGNEEIPPDLPEEFRYVEREYVYAEDLKHLKDLPEDVWLRCDHKSCKQPSWCDCQPEGASFEIFKKNTSGQQSTVKRGFPYSNGKFAFLFNMVESPKCVIECNKYCECPSSCPNRVAQQPRKVPIEIFKTESYGWGARATVRIDRGTVLGIYTGDLMKRAAAESLPESKDYIFALDWLEATDDDNDRTEKYSVDSYSCGNWTRFINHSCDPNLMIYPVAYDSIPDVNIPYLAFVATRFIPPREEFTFDYQPRTPKGVPVVMKPGKKAMKCKCGSKKCCTWLR